MSGRAPAIKPSIASKLMARGRKLAAKTEGNDRLSQIFYVASQLFCEQGFDATSMSNIADAVGVTKAAIYHFVPGGKKDLLYAIIAYGMDTVQEAVVTPASAVNDAEQRLRTIIINHAKLVMGGSTAKGFNPVTITSDEVAALSPAHRRIINQRKRAYMDFVRATLEHLGGERKLKDLDVAVLAFSVIGMIVWLGHWYRPNGRLTSDQVAETICTAILGGILREDSRPASQDAGME